MTISKTLLVAGGCGLLTILSAVACVSSSNNDCVRQESGLEAQWNQNKNNYANYFNKLKETASVPEMYAVDLQKTYVAALQGRYGSDGSKAVFQFIQEHNPNFDSKLYTQIQQIIEAGRNSFEADQKMLLDKRRVYEITLHSFPNNVIVGILGYPKVDLKKYDPVTNAETENAFRTHEAGPIKLR